MNLEQIMLQRLYDVLGLIHEEAQETNALLRTMRPKQQEPQKPPIAGPAKKR